MNTVLPDHVLKLMAHDERAKMGKSGMTADEAEQKYSDGQEDCLQKDIRQYLNLHDVVFICPTMRKRSALPPGWPDLTFAYKGVPCAAEAKAGRNKLDPDQEKMRDKMLANGWRWVEARSVTDVQALFRSIEADLSTIPRA